MDATSCAQKTLKDSSQLTVFALLADRVRATFTGGSSTVAITPPRSFSTACKKRKKNGGIKPPLSLSLSLHELHVLAGHNLGEREKGGGMQSKNGKWVRFRFHV
jgi:ribosomal protein L4